MALNPRRFWRRFFLIEKTPVQHSGRLLRDYPELKLFPPGEPTRLEWAWIRMRSTLPALLWSVPYFVFVLFVIPRVENWVAGGFTIATITGGGSVLMVLGVVILLGRVRTRSEHRQLRRKLLQRGVPICIRCGYDPGSWTGRCPECGHPITRPSTPAG